jgi:protein SCO1/2
MQKLFTIFAFVGALGLEGMLWSQTNEVTSETSSTLPPEMQQLTIEEKLGNKVKVNDLTFTNELGEKVNLGDFFNKGKPVLLTMVYYRCPGICNYLLNGFVNSARSLEFEPGTDYEIVTVSMNHREGPDLALAKKDTYVRQLGRLGSEAGWHWLVGAEDQIAKLAEQIGFRYAYDEASGEYAHSSALFVLTADGRLSQVLYGVDFPYRDLRLALVEASEGKIGTILDRVMLFCYQYDPFQRGYSLQALRLVQAGGLLTLLILGSYMFLFWRRERRKTVGH